MTRVVIVGAAGRMGLALVRGCPSVEGIQLAGAVERPECPAVGRDVGVLAGMGEAGVAIGTDLKPLLAGCNAVIDFSFHTSVPAHAADCVRAGRAMVIGTTGLSPEELAAVRDASARVPIVMAPNMSLGVNLLFSLVRQAAAVLGPEYDIEVVEMHHRLKKDSPSGTALRLAEKAAEGRGQDLKRVAVYGRDGLVGERPRGEIGIHAVRGGDIAGDHSVYFAAEGERVELAHRATSRETFARGALTAARWVAGRKPGLYDMQDVLGLSGRA